MTEILFISKTSTRVAGIFKVLSLGFYRVEVLEINKFKELLLLTTSSKFQPFSIKFRKPN
mgnify:CR=1 FL=1